ncbi:hypothetical protein [Flavobacterium amnicola]|uniref:hypothetical protein n=1 Tax=Flavobacterium amnicola TaxID=2506422 RepID=UPI0013E95217|nr:hypothetical protein [Flavobacterium amnicola]
MKTFFYTISFLALLGSPASCAIEQMRKYDQQALETESSEHFQQTETDIDPPIPAQIPR